MNIKFIIMIRNIMASTIASIILIWVFFQNNMLTKLIISPFLICSIALFLENFFLLLNKIKIAKIFSYIFKFSFFLYAICFLIYATYYTIVNKTYSLLIIIIIFAIIIFRYIKIFFKNNKK